MDCVPFHILCVIAGPRTCLAGTAPWAAPSLIWRTSACKACIGNNRILQKPHHQPHFLHLRLLHPPRSRHGHGCRLRPRGLTRIASPNLGSRTRQFLFFRTIGFNPFPNEPHAYDLVACLSGRPVGAGAREKRIPAQDSARQLLARGDLPTC